jgi:hypothetical protein
LQEGTDFIKNVLDLCFDAIGHFLYPGDILG